jgi:integrase
MSLYRRGETWWYKFQFAGQSVRESAKTKSKTVAAQAERERRGRMANSFNNIQKRPTPMLFSVAARNWLETHPEWRPRTLEVQELALKHLSPVFARVLISDITADDVARYQSSRLLKGASPRTVNIEVTALRAILIKHRLWETISQEVKMLKEPKSAGRVLSLPEQEVLLVECRASGNPALYPIVETALATGMRSDEIRQLRWSQITENITVGHSKTDAGENRVVPINSRLRQVLDLWAGRFPSRRLQHFVFCDDDPTRPIGSWKKSWKRACRRAGLGELRFHDLRHTAVTRMLEAGVPFAHVARVLGWCPSTTTEMAKRYGHIADKTLASAVESLAVGTISLDWAQKWAQLPDTKIERIQ